MSADTQETDGPLRGVRVVEIAGQGPGPFAAMMLADLGAEVLRVDRADAVGAIDAEAPNNEVILQRGRRSVAVDLKHPDGPEVVLTLVDRADALIEGFRPGVLERLGIGPDACLARNERLVFARITGWGQDGPLSQAPGHDINYIALTGVLHSIGNAGERPVPPLNIVGDYGGGMMLALGVVSGVLNARVSGKGQVVDAAMLDSTALLAGLLYGMYQNRSWSSTHGENLLDGGAHFYGVYETADGRWISLGAIEPKFYELLLRALGLAGQQLPGQYDRASWPGMRERFAVIFKAKTREQWCETLEPLGACFAPVLDIDEAFVHAHNDARGVFVQHDGLRHPAPAPRFSRTPGRITRGAARPGEHSAEALRSWGFDPSDVERLLDAGAVRAAGPRGVT
jgi:alpha-methylacyl-CoA racemase